MNFFEVVSKIELACLSHKNIKTFHEGTDLKENFTSGIEYPAIALKSDTHTIHTNYTIYRFHMAYIDRLIQDRRNKLEVQSAAMTTLQEIVNRLMYDMGFSFDTTAPNINYSLQADIFTEKFANECAGAVISIEINEENIGDCFY